MEEQLAELGLFAALALGIILGIRHSLDPDHVVAVSTIVSEYRNPLRSFWVGISWGLGHTTTLLIIGVVIIALRLTIPDRMALLFEFFVGIMLVALGAQVIYSFRRKKVHQHAHGHQEAAHEHFHSHAQSPEHRPEHHEAHGIGKPFLRKKSYLVGTVHGVAGSAALTLLVLASIESPLAGLGYILLFGLGSVLSMGVMTILIGLPFVISAGRLPNLNRAIQFGVGTLSIIFGGFLMYQIGFVDGLF
ncbi:MAG: urease accessory protein UreH [Chloroflexi bacterium]|nr:urease accessory protein UreH [Chloroflexota bacterium]MCI0878149.1 urease accessory protein UreH [Chloroflexota bacterium]